MVLALWALVAVLVVLITVGSAHGAKPDAREDAHRCTHGASSIGPVTIVHGKVVSGSVTPDTEACLP
jgi:hypothetical protein